MASQRILHKDVGIGQTTGAASVALNTIAIPTGAYFTGLAKVNVRPQSGSPSTGSSWLWSFAGYNNAGTVTVSLSAQISNVTGSFTSVPTATGIGSNFVITGVGTAGVNGDWISALDIVIN